ncbi:ATP/GTP-binding protein [Sinomonas halotolerans]|uniref:ATP/GTP-binding protein n=1 Tax=Sinomonas halotolerans TaxID=1644133 RepID=A0ABU9WWR0_9MICC
MPRSNRPRRRPSSSPAPRGARADRGGQDREDREDFDPERVLAGFARLESAPDGDWRVRQVTTRTAAKEYTCPECSRVIPPGVAHLVVWADDHLFGEAAGISERRHWHTHCWRTRSYRRR